MKHDTRRRAALAALVMGTLFAAAAAPAQQREYFIRGRVVDTDKKPLAGVELRLLDVATSRAYHIKTGKDGAFKFAGLPHGIYQATFTLEGYTPKTDEWKFETQQETMQRVDVPDVVLVSQAQVQAVQVLKEMDAGVKQAAEVLRKGDTDAGIAQLQGLLQKKPDDVNALYLLGLAYARKDMAREALAPLTRVTELNPGFAGAWLEIGVCQRRLGDTEKALAAYDKALLLDPASVDAAHNSGLLLFEANRIDEALARFEKGIALKPDDPDLLDMAARCYVNKGDLGRAAEYLAKARAVTTDPAKAALLDELLAKVKAQVK